MSAQRNPSAAPTPLDRASFYIESLKYGPGVGEVEAVGIDQIAAQLETLLRDANVNSMTGAELAAAMRFYGNSLARSFGAHPALTLSCFADGVMHGIALAGGLEGEHRDSRGEA